MKPQVRHPGTKPGTVRNQVHGPNGNRFPPYRGNRPGPTPEAFVEHRSIAELFIALNADLERILSALRERNAG